MQVWVWMCLVECIQTSVDDKYLHTRIHVLSYARLQNKMSEVCACVCVSVSVYADN